MRNTSQRPNTKSPSAPPPPCPIICLGASAGGLEAIEKFFDHLPADSHVACVVIQHADPSHKSLLSEILRSHTTMPIFEIQDGMPVQPDSIYIPPSDRQAAIINRTFQLLEPVKIAGVTMPIDGFLRTLADDAGELAIGIILSGTGTDGTSGVKAIKEAGGMVIVQDTQQAKFDSMPRSAIQTGVVDYILPVEQMPAALRQYVQHPFLSKAAFPEQPEENLENALQKVFVLLRSATGHDFSNYKRTTIHRRIGRRMAINRIDRLLDYIRFLHQEPAEQNRLFKDLLIGVTNFFRDAEAFELLKEQVMRPLMLHRPLNVPIRIWAPGCSTGEEAYSLAILLAETMDSLKRHYEVQIFASDLDSESVDYARAGVYPENIKTDVTPARLSRFFLKEKIFYRMKSSVREMVVFVTHNLIKDPPFSRIDFVSCRNLLIYMDTMLQKKILLLLHYALNPGGFLFLGRSESIGECTDLFEPLDLKWKIFQRQEITPDRTAGFLPSVAAFTTTSLAPKDEAGMLYERTNMYAIAEKIILNEYAPPAVIIDQEQQILYFIGQTDRFLTTPTGEPNFQLSAMLRHGLQHSLFRAIQQAGKKQQSIVTEGIRIHLKGATQTVKITVKPLSGSHFPRHAMLIIFQEEPAIQAPVLALPEGNEVDPRVSNLQNELQLTKENLQTTIAALQISNEKLKSMNEELQSMNEELQSSNEELKTSKEEIQSTNEELVSVNTELQGKIEELTRVNNDINNLLVCTDIGTIFLDTDLRIKRFTPAVTQLFNLIASDLDRPISDIRSTLIEYDRLYEDAKRVLDTLSKQDQEIQTKDGRWYSMRIHPYRTMDNIIDGVVITFVEFTELKQIQAKLSTAYDALNSSINGVILTNIDGRITYANPAFLKMFGYGHETDVLTQPAGMLFASEEITTLHDLDVLVAPPGEGHREVLMKRRANTTFPAEVSASPVTDNTGKRVGSMASFFDISKRKRAQVQQQDLHIYATTLLDMIRRPVLVLDADLKVKAANSAFYRTFQAAKAETEQKPIYELGDRQWDIPQLRECFAQIIPENQHLTDYEVEHEFPQIGRKKMRLNARRIEQTSQEQSYLILLEIEDMPGREV